MKGITIVLILGLIALAMILPASAAGQGGNGKMLQNGVGSDLNSSCCQNLDCPNNGTPRQDGTGQRCGNSGMGCGKGDQSGHRGQGYT